MAAVTTTKKPAATVPAKPAKASMPAVPYISPWHELRSIQRNMDDLISRAFGFGPLAAFTPVPELEFEACGDVFETDQALQIIAPMPGYQPDKINLEITPTSVLIQAERTKLYEPDRGISHQQSEFSEEGRFRAEYALPVEIDPNKVTATYENGVLTVNLPKSEQAKAKTVHVKVAGK